jgi:hypothetical protein
MSTRLPPPPPGVIEELRSVAERRLSAEEFDAYVNAPMSEEEREETLAMIAWFNRRYPTPRERLAYARRAFARLAGRAPYYR